MVNLQMNKDDFIKNRLLPLCQAINPDVVSLSYIENSSYDEEFCEVVFKNGGAKKVNITACSFSCITKDVVKAVE